MYRHCVGIGGAVMCWTVLVKLHLSEHEPDVQWNCLRHMHAAAHIQYYSLQGSAGLTEEEMCIIQGRNLLTVDECQRVVAYAGFRPILPITWALAEVKSLMKSDADNGYSAVSELRWNEFLSVALQLRSECSVIVNLLQQPVPWAYFHLLNLMSFLTLLMVSYCLVFASSWPITVVVHAVICLIVLGLKNLACSMADPFGQHVERAVLMVPRSSLRWPPGAAFPAGFWLLAAPCARDKPLRRIGPKARWRCGREARPKPPTPRPYLATGLATTRSTSESRGSSPSQHGQSAPLAVPQLASCAYSGSAWRLWSSSALPE